MASDFSNSEYAATPERFASSEDLQSWFRSLSADAKVLPTGRGTKLARGSAGETLCFADMTGIKGIAAYDPSEFLITARAGTPMREIVVALAEHGQYLPSDPCLLDEGATLGGTLAAGISGPSRLLYGSLRDFVMEVQFLDGLGNLVRGGGKVVKNAAGFDFPKLMVGSLGRLGMITEATLKVFPRPSSTATVCIAPGSVKQAIVVAHALQSQPIPLSGITIACDDAIRMYVQIASPEASLTATSQRIEAIVSATDASLGVQHIAASDEQSVLSELSKHVFVFPNRNIVRTCQAPNKVAELDTELANLGLPRQYWSAGEVCWIDVSEQQQEGVDEVLCRLGISGLRLPLSASDDTYRVGHTGWLAGANRLKSALDPDGRFPSY